MATLTQTVTPVPDNAVKDAGYVTRWKTTKPVAFSPESLLDLLDGRTPLLKHGNFLDGEICDRFAEILEPNFSPYLYATGPAIHKVGLAQFEFQAQAKDDFANRKGDGKIPLVFFFILRLVAAQKEWQRPREYRMKKGFHVIFITCITHVASAREQEI
jgi:hypothetical protein